MNVARRTRLLAVAGAVATTLGLLVFMFVFSTRYQAPAGQEDPKITDWMQAWGSLLGVFAGLGAALAASWLLLHERKQARIAQAAQQRESEERYAEQVTWYLREQTDQDSDLRQPVDAGDFWGAPEGATNAVLVLLNNSHSCIYEVVVSIPEFSHKEEYREFDQLALRGIGTIPPGKSEIVMPMRGWRNFYGSGSYRILSELPSNSPVEYVQFRDPSDRRWRRTGRGELIRLSPDDPGAKFPNYAP